MPAGITPYGAGAHLSQGLLSINPVSLGPFVSLNSISGLSGTIDGSQIALWPDESGNNNDATQGVVNDQPFYRSTGLSVSSNGSPMVQFVGGNAAAFASNMGETLVSNPSVASGYDLLFYGRFSPAVNAFLCSVIFQDNTGSAPQVGYEDTGGQRYFERDAGGTKTGSAFGTGYYGTQRWTFTPITATTGSLEAFANGTAVLSTTYNFNPILSAGWGIGANQVDNCACKMDLGAFCWFTRVLTTRQANGIFRFWRGQFG